MPCSSCTETQTLPIDFITLNIGTVGISTAYKVYFKNLSTNRENVYDITSTGAGLLQIVRETAVLKLVPNEWYEVRAVLASATNINDNVNISIASVNYTCLLMKFYKVLDGAMEVEGYTTITVEV